MQATALAPQVWQRWRDARQVTLVVAFEDSSTGTRAREFRQELSRQLGRECRIVEHVWLFNMFRLRELREIAAEEAAAADMVAISVHNSEALPAEVNEWVRLWLRQKGAHKPVLLALLEPPKEGAPRNIEASLKQAAREAGIDCLIEFRLETETR
jgi:hypothetical protein